MGIHEGLNPQYIVDENGSRKAVILSIDEFHELLEDLEDLAVAAQRRDEETVPHETVVKSIGGNEVSH